MRYRDLAAALDARIPLEQVLECCTVDTIEVRSEAASVTLTHVGTTRHIEAKLVVHAEGNPADNPDVKIHDYGQHAIIAEVRPATAHNNRAWERFTADGPLALLPIGPDYAVVFTVPSRKPNASSASTRNF
jgi:2-octaprenyl-6-methoxyphenol hydroxylase